MRRLSTVIRTVIPTMVPARSIALARGVGPRRVVRVALALTILVTGCAGQDGVAGGGSGRDADGGEGTGAGSAEETSEPPVTIHMGTTVSSNIVLYVMEHLPEVTPNLGTRYEIEWLSLPVSEHARGLAAGTLDAAPIAAVVAATVIERGTDLVITGSYIEAREPYASVTWLVDEKAGITSPADLKGRTVATIAPGQLLDVVADTYFRAEGGLEPDEDYDKVVIPYSQMLDALRSSRIATGPFHPPFLGQALDTGEVRPLFDLLDVWRARAGVVQVFRRDFVTEHRAVMDWFMEDWAATWAFVEDPANRDAVIEVISEVTGVPVEEFDAYLMTTEDVYRPPGGVLDVAAVQDAWDFFREEGPLRADLDVDDHIIPELPPAAT